MLTTIFEFKGYVNSSKQLNSFPIECNPLPDDKILDWPKSKQIAEENLKNIKNEK